MNKGPRRRTMNRATKKEEKYFIAQLGYGMFPWLALTPVALGVWLQLRPADSSGASCGRAAAPERQEAHLKYLSGRDAR